MSVTKQFLDDKLIEGYVKTPPTLKEQALTKLAIKLCQNADLRKDILCSLKPTTPNTGTFAVDIRNVWDEPIENRSNSIIESLNMPSTLKSELLFRMWSISQELFSWNKHHQVLLRTPPEFLDQFLFPSDWTIEGRLNERKIAYRLVRDERIAVSQRYQLACLYCLEPYITLFWNQIPVDDRQDLYDRSRVVDLWNVYLEGKEDLMVCYEEDFQCNGLIEAMEEGATTAFVFFWKALNEGKKQEIVVETAMKALSESIDNIVKVRWMWSLIWIGQLHGRILRPTYCTDILYFLYSQMSDKQKNLFLRQTIKLYEKFKYFKSACIFEVFLQWPYQNCFKSIINKSWGILHVNHFRDILLMLACNYSNQSNTYRMKSENQDYDYGGLLVELLEQAPNHYKRYLFDCKTCYGIADLLLKLCSKPLFARRDIRIIKKVLQQATGEEKELFKRSQYGKSLCLYLIKCENWELVDGLLIECVPEDELASFKKQCLQSYLVNELSDFITRDNEDPFHVFLNWMCSSLEDINEFKLALMSQCDFFRLASELKLDHLDKLMQRCLQSEEARKHYKEQCIKREGMYICLWLIERSEWEKLMQFLNWCFASEEAVNEFKRDMFIQMGTNICGLLMLDGEPETVKLFYKWYNLSPEAIIQLKNETFFSFEFLREIYVRLCQEDELEVIALCLKWGLTDEDAVSTCRKSFDEVILKCSGKIYRYDNNKDLQFLAQQRWNKLIEERLYDIGNKMELDVLQDGIIPCKKYKRDIKCYSPYKYDG